MTESGEAMDCGERTVGATAHEPVLLREIVEYLRPNDRTARPVALDGTLGGGGHSEALLAAYPNLFLIGIDRDAQAVERSTRRLASFESRTYLRQANFCDFRAVLEGIPDSLWPADAGDRNESGLSARQRASSTRVDMRQVDRALLDLGMSSDQLENGERGFSFRDDAALDMRMNTGEGLTGAEILNTLEPRELKRLFLRGGVSGLHASSLAKEVFRSRPIETTGQFRAACERSAPVRERIKGRHPATVPFQALRMAVNDEIRSIEQFLDEILPVLAPQGRLAVIAFHSLEDELVTHTMRRWSRGRTTPGGIEKDGELLTKKAVTPGEDEISRNPRSRSARLRVFERCGGKSEEGR